MEGVIARRQLKEAEIISSFQGETIITAVHIGSGVVVEFIDPADEPNSVVLHRAPSAPSVDSQLKNSCDYLDGAACDPIGRFMTESTPLSADILVDKAREIYAELSS